MSVPEAVKRQAEESEKALNDFVAKQSTDAAEAEAAQTDDSHGTQSDQQAPVVQASPGGEALSALERDLELERQRNRSLQGRLDSQLATANRENKELKTQVQELMSRMDEMAKKDAIPGAKRYITAEEASDLGEDVLGMQERIIKGKLEEELESGTVKEFINNLIEQSMAVRAQQQSAPVDMATFWAGVERFYPGAQQLNSTDQGWFSFLDKYDQASGVRNRDIGTQAIANGDIVTLVDLLESFKPVGQVVKSAGKAVKPETTGGATIIPIKQESEWTRGEVEQFYDDVARKKFKGTPAEAKALESQIMEAAQAGRITG